MLNSFFSSVEQLKYKHESIHRLVHNETLRSLVNKYNTLKFHWYQRPNAQKFFTQNTDRVATITNMLADEKSKIVYNGIVNFRQSGRKRDFPIEHYDKIPYFINEIKLSPNEVFVDCGAFDGDTIEDFLKYCPEYKQIVAFEPESTNFQKLQTKHQSNPKMRLINAGAWYEDGIVSFVGSEVSGTIIAGGGYSIPVKSIDGLGLDAVTFIKMDIEGSEMKALEGAKNTILKHKPNLAICIYHSNEDMLDIPEYIHNLVPEYKLYVRQHMPYPRPVDTVLYAML